MSACTRRWGISAPAARDYIKRHGIEQAAKFYEAGGRAAKVKTYEYQGARMTLTEICNLTGANLQRIYRRVVKQGMSVEEALTIRIEDVYSRRVKKGWEKRCQG